MGCRCQSGQKATLSHTRHGLVNPLHSLSSALTLAQLGFKTVKEDSLSVFYAVFFTPSITEDTNNCTLIEACESGWWYSSPLPSNHHVVIYHTDDSEPTSCDARKPDRFMNLLNNATVHISQAISKHDYDPCVDPKARFPICTMACSACLDSPCQTVFDGGARWCAVGDATMAFDPLSSHGLMLSRHRCLHRYCSCHLEHATCGAQAPGPQWHTSVVGQQMLGQFDFMCCR